MEVLYAENPSDHFPLLLMLADHTYTASVEHSTALNKVIKTIYPWLQANHFDFKLHMLHSTKIKVDFNNASIDALNQNLNSAITECALLAGMYQESSFSDLYRLSQD